MKQRPHRGKPHVDADGVRITHHNRTLLLRGVPLIATAVTVLLGAFLVIRIFDRPEHLPEAGPAGHASIDSRRAPVPRQADKPAQVEEPTPRKHVRTKVRRRTEARASGNRPQDESGIHPSEDGRVEIDARDYIAELRARGETAGLAAFSPPGTRPPRTGVIVPDDYVLPEGFARHYQTTDDGRRLGPILTVAPEYELVDYEGNLIHLTDGYIVPPEFAPPDLPVRMLEIPSEYDRERSDR